MTTTGVLLKSGRLADDRGWRILLLLRILDFDVAVAGYDHRYR